MSDDLTERLRLSADFGSHPRGLRAIAAEAADRIEDLEADTKRNAEGWSDAVDRIGELEAALREIGDQGFPSFYSEKINLCDWIDRNTDIARRALDGKR